MGTWQVQQAKARLSEVIEEARTSGPQLITRHGVEQAAVISITELRRLQEHDAEARKAFWAKLSEGQPFDDDVFDNLHGPNDVVREIDL